jgi:prepilin-type N-terminal cleavage/methylation domain-containing protein
MESTRDSGFTLIETLVAFTVFALIAGAFQLCLSMGWRSVRSVALEEAAIELARSELSAAGFTTPLAAGVSEGTNGAGFTWTREILPHAIPGDEFAEPGATRAFRILVSVRWQDGPLRPERAISLETIRLGTGE